MQEATLPNHATMYYGTYHTPAWKALLSAIMAHDVFPLEFFSQSLNMARQIYLIGNMRRTMMTLLKKSVDRQVTDKRERVFGILGLLDQKKRKDLAAIVDIEPGYNKPEAEVFREAFRFSILESQSLGILHFVESLYEHEVREEYGSIYPSWVSRNLSSESIDRSRTQHLRPSIETEDVDLERTADNNVLRIRGSSIDVVSAVHYAFSANMKTSTSQIQQATACMSPYPYSDGEHRYRIPEAVCRAITCNLRSFGYTDETLERSMHCFLGPKYSIFPNGLPSDGTPGPFLRVAKGYTRGRALFTTQNASIGIGLIGIQEGDVVARLRGDDSAGVLRPRGDSWLFLGQAYVLDLPWVSL